MGLTQPSQLLPLLLFFFFFFCTATSLASIASSPAESPQESSPADPPTAFPPTPSIQNATIEYMDPTFPPLLPTQNPKCSLLVLQQHFSNNRSSMAVATYTPPSECPAPWSRVILDLSASSSGLQKDRIAAIWLDGVEILRTTTPLPMDPGVSWHVRKDVTRYTALLRGTNGRSSLFSMMVDKSTDGTFPGVYSINATLHFYRGAVYEHMVVDDSRNISLMKTGAIAASAGENSVLNAHPTIRGLYSEPANLVLPLSRSCDDAGDGFWLKVTNESDVQTKKIVIPRNTYRAVLEVYVSHHDKDEYWYGNPFRTTTNLGGNVGGSGRRYGSTKTNGGFRQVVAFIDRKYVGSVVPFPVIYPSSVNPYFWVPVAAIGAYNHPSYDLDLTPFVGQLVDGQPHEFGVTVRESQPYWLVDANLHIWLDPWSDQTQGGLIRYKVPPLRLRREADWDKLDGKSEVEGQVTVRFSGWVGTSEGNTTTSVRHKFKFKSHIEVEDKGDMKNVEVESQARTSIRIERDHEVIGRVAVETDNPLQMTTMSSIKIGGSESHRAKLFHAMMETRSMTTGKREIFSTITDRQQSLGSMLIEDGMVVSGTGDTKSTYKYRDEKACYLRKVNMVGGTVKEDMETASCSTLSDY